MSTLTGKFTAATNADAPLRRRISHSRKCIVVLAAVIAVLGSRSPWVPIVGGLCLIVLALRWKLQRDELHRIQGQTTTG